MMIYRHSIRLHEDFYIHDFYNSEDNQYYSISIRMMNFSSYFSIKFKGGYVYADYCDDFEYEIPKLKVLLVPDIMYNSVREKYLSSYLLKPLLNQII